MAGTCLTNGSGESLAESESGGAGLRSDVEACNIRPNLPSTVQEAPGKDDARSLVARSVFGRYALRHEVLLILF